MASLEEVINHLDSLVPLAEGQVPAHSNPEAWTDDKLVAPALKTAWPEDQLVPQLKVSGVKAGDAEKTVDRALLDTENKPVVLVEIKSLGKKDLSPYGSEATNYCQLAQSFYGKKPRWAWLTNGREWWLFDSYQQQGKDPLLRLSLPVTPDRKALAQLLLAQGTSSGPDDESVLQIATETLLVSYLHREC